MKLSRLWASALSISAAVLCFPLTYAQPTMLWQIGDDEDPLSRGYLPVDEFSEEDGLTSSGPGFVTRLPGDAAYNPTTNPSRDDHFYQKGTYPAGFNGLTAPLLVPNSEPAAAFERCLINSDPTNRIHFILNAAQASPQARLRLTFELVDGRLWSPGTGRGEGFGQHDVALRWLNSAGNTLLLSRTGIDRDTRFTIDIPASSVQALAGPNTLQFTRTGPLAPAGSYAWVNFDFVKVEVDTDALADGDADGLPRWWERDHLLSDANPSDAAADIDNDNLTALQEFNGGLASSNPRAKDTDGDGLKDNEERAATSNPNLQDSDGDGLSDLSEISINPTSSPVLTDTDSDNFPDAWEKRVGSNPRSSSSVPTVFSGAIGLNFVSLENVTGSVPSLLPAGVVPQMFWNNTVPMRSWSRPSGNTADIATPTAGGVSYANGQPVPGMTVSWVSDSTTTTYNDGNAEQKLMNGLLATSATLTVAGIPFAQYHIFVYVGGAHDGQRASVRLNNESLTTRPFTTLSAAPQMEWLSIAEPTAAIPSPYGNYVCYENRTGTSVSISVNRVDGFSSGLHAVQIVDATRDVDASGIPDWYEMQYSLQPAGPALATADADGDGLTNLQEFQRNSNPRKFDTDGDGLADNQESAANALKIDSDGDGLSDFDEANTVLPSNPNLADSDGDGVSDLIEKRSGSDPAVNPATTLGYLGKVPVYSSSPVMWEWKVDPIQLVWDHGSGIAGGGDGNNNSIFSVGVGNVLASSRRSIELELRTKEGKLTYLFKSERTAGFSASSDANSNIILQDSNTPTPDLTAALGFSGYGAFDFSDQLSFRLLATRGSGNVWTVTFEIFNLTRNLPVVTRLVSQSTAAPTLFDGTATWQDSLGVLGSHSLEPNQGIRCFLTPTALETIPEFAPYKDTDDDGMPNSWELLYQFNINSSADASSDADGDGLKNRDEYLAGTHPRLIDTDGDGVSDHIERSEGSNPLIPNLKPLFANGAVSTGTDLNLNGLPDPWEARFQAGGLSSLADTDGDGASNAKEASWGTDPFDAESTIALSIGQSGNDNLLRWTRNPWKRQLVYRSENLSSWQSLTLPVTPSGAEDSALVSDPSTSPQRAFFKVDTIDRDTDADGVSDWDETFMGSDPFLRDSSNAPASAFNANGSVTGNVSGDYTSFTSRFRNASPNGSGGQVTRVQAARFLLQASFGPTLKSIDEVQALGFSAWIDDQISNQPATLQRPIIEAMIRDYRGPRIDLSYNYDNDEVAVNNLPTAFARGAILGPDQLRQRMAFALSQILVTSRRDTALSNKPLSMADYYDIFLRHGLGNYRDILSEVTLHPVMGRYLSHIGNQKARPEINQFPDENYAREIMQLFTIGLWELNQDGTRKRDGNGNFIPTYNNRDVTEVARVFTGLWFGKQRWNYGGISDASYSIPMMLWPDKHDFGSKTMLGGLTIPERSATVENGMRDISDVVDFLFTSRNTAPFISRQLIQFLVTSNPSPAYVGRVAAVFENNGNGIRGDLAATAKAILLDPEAREIGWSLGSVSFGRLKDPVQRAMALARAGRLARFPNLAWWDYGNFYEDALQSPGDSPSVFNFYRPDYRSPGLLTENYLNGPAFQIMNSYSSISFPYRLWEQAVKGIQFHRNYMFNPDYKDFLEVASDAPALADRANLLFCGGMMSATTRAKILGMLNQVSTLDPLQRVQLTVYLATACPEGAIQR